MSSKVEQDEEVLRKSVAKSQTNPMFDKIAKEEEELKGEDKVKLSSVFEKKYTYYMVGGVLINIVMLLYSHFGLSAVIKASTCPEGFEGCPDAIDASALRDACVNPSDLAILAPGSVALTELPLYMQPIGLDCFGADQCIVDSVMALHGLSLPCASCYALSAGCAIEFCLGPCLINSFSAACLRCNRETCDPPFENCTGVEFPSNEIYVDFVPTDEGDGDEDEGVILIEGEECFDREQFELFKVFNLTFINSIEEAIKGDSVALALLIVLASGVWPYTKNGLMLYVWFAPLSTKRRDFIFRILGVLGKWSLVDVFAVVVIINGVNIQKVLQGNAPLVVFAESRPGIYMFGIGALWALGQGEVMRHFDQSRRNSNRENKEIKISKPDASQIFKMKLLRVIIGISAVFALWFGFMGLVGLNLSFELEGEIESFEGINGFGFSTIEMATGLIDKCAIFEGHESIAGAHFLAFLFIFMVGIIPMFSSIMLFFFAMMYQPQNLESRFTTLTFGISNFACLDVFFLSVATLASQFEGLIDAAVGDGVNDQCGISEADEAAGDFCIRFFGTIETGTWFILIATVSFWIALYAGGRLVFLSKSLIKN